MIEEKEIDVVTFMIELYCRKKHAAEKGRLCPACAELLEYVKLRRSKCPWGDEKPFCSNCKIHCYRPEMRKKIAEVMRFSGPRMLFHHPVVATKHLMETKRQQKRRKREERERADKNVR